MRLASLVSATALILLYAAASPAAEAKRWALLVGVNDYVEFKDLAYAGADAVALGGALAQTGFDPDRIFLLHDGAQEARYRPFKKNIEKQLEIVLKVAGPDDLVIVSFSGHGIHIDGKSYFCPSEADDTAPDETMIAVDEIYKKFEACPAALKLMVVDACRDDPRPRSRKSATPDADRKNFGGSFERPPDGVVVLSSCGPGQKSYEDEELQHGVFMHYVLEGLSGEADGNRNGRVTLGELYDYASGATRLFVAKAHNDYQVPAQRGEINGIFELPRSAPAKEFTNTIGVKLSLVPAGEFLMGSDDADDEARDAEKPQHSVRITRPFYMGRHEITRGQFAQFVDAENYETEAERDGLGGGGYNSATNGLEQPKLHFTWRNTGWDQTDEHPVVNVSWNDADAFCRWLSKHEGKTYRLPTEAEWEYSCRAGTTSRYCHGDDHEGAVKFGNLYDDTAAAMLKWTANGLKDGYVFTAPVGRYKPNPFGLYDMHGNVYEWCYDWQEPYADGAVSDPRGPADPTNGTFCVLRGGSWNNPPAVCRSACRDRAAPTHTYYNIGFRVALSP